MKQMVMQQIIVVPTGLIFFYLVLLYLPLCSVHFVQTWHDTMVYTMVYDLQYSLKVTATFLSCFTAALLPCILVSCVKH